MSNRILAFATVAAVAAFVSAAKAEDGPQILGSITGSQYEVLSNQAMSEVTGTFLYTVEPGDTLSSIAEDNDVSEQQIYNAQAPNGVPNSNIIGADPNLIRPGETIWIPTETTSTTTTPTTPTTTTMTTMSGPRP